MNKPDNVINLDWELLNRKYKNMHRVIKKINNNYPVQYLIGDVDFYGNKIFVNKNVLIPRFETETLIEKTINYIKEYNLVNGDVFEIGTGSGCISITLKKEIPSLNIDAIDISKKALKVANKNASSNKVNLNLKRQDIFKYKGSKKYSLIISNPPYIDRTIEVDPKTKYEPENAIFADNKGLVFYEYIIKNAKDWVEDKFIIAFEIGEEQGNYLKKYAKEYFNDCKIRVDKDLAGKDRYLFIISE